MPQLKKDFVDVLFNLLYMPFVTVTSLLKNVGMVSCTGNLFQSLENLSEAHLIPSQNTDELLKPILKWEKVSVLLQTHACLRPVPVQKKLYICQSNHRYVTNKIYTRIPLCAYRMFNELQQLNMDSESECRTMKKSVSYMVTDDIGVLEDTVVDIGLDELRSSFYLASSPCSNFYFNNTKF